MPTKSKIELTEIIEGSVKTVWHKMLDIENYKAWTEVFSPGSYYKGTFTLGTDIHFLSNYEGGMAGKISKYKYLELVTISFVGWLDKDGELDTSEASLSTKDSIEQYTFTKIDEHTTKLDIYVDTSPEYHDMMAEMWPKALKKLKEICEK